MSYTKNYEVGSIRLAAPYVHYSYELPLVSFGDDKHIIPISLIYRSNLTDNPFYIVNGMKLNIQKRLIMSNGTYPVRYEDSDGSTVSLNNFVNYFTFNDDSKRIIRYVNGNFVLENSDYSTETYNTSGNIISIKDKYGEEYLSCVYTSGKLSSIKYLGVERIRLSYYTDGAYIGSLEKIEYVYGGSTFNIKFVYNVENVKIQHCSGVDYHFVFLSGSFTVYSVDKNGNYFSTPHAHKLSAGALTTEENGVVQKTIEFTKYIGDAVVDRTTYKCLNVNSEDKFTAVYITDFNGVINRVQYENDKPCYSYEVADTLGGIEETNNFFEVTENNAEYLIYKGNVNINTDGASGVQGVNDSAKMTCLTGGTIDRSAVWNRGFSPTESLYGAFVISGWVFAEKDATYTVTVGDYSGGFATAYEGCTLNNLTPGVYNFFSFKTYIKDPEYVSVAIVASDGYVISQDVRIAFEEGKVYGVNYFNHFTVNKDVLVKEGTGQSNERIIYFDSGLRFYNGNSLITDKITINDIWKYKINQSKNLYPNEIYYDNCKGIITGAGTFRVEFDEQGETTTNTYSFNVADLAVGVIRTVNERTYLSKTNCYVDSSNNKYSASKAYMNNSQLSSEIYDDHFDVTSSTTDGVTTQYTRDGNGRITVERVLNSNEILYTRTTSYSQDSEGNPTITATDEFGESTVYTLDSVWGAVVSVSLPDGTTITDGYDDDMCSLISKTFAGSDDNEREHQFSYSGGNLSGLSSGSIGYGFSYTRGTLSDVTKFGYAIEKHILSNNDKTLTSYYPSQSSPVYTVIQNTDNYGRLTSVNGLLQNTYDINPAVNASDGSYTVRGINNGSAKLATSEDLTTGKKIKYAYDTGRLVRAGTFDSSGTKIDESSCSYDNIGRLTSETFIYSNNSKSVQSSIVYEKAETDPLADNKIDKYYYKVNGSQKSLTDNGYDGFGRLASKRVTIENGTYFYRSFYYEKRRVTSIAEAYGSTPKCTSSYVYDDLGRVIEYRNSDISTVLPTTYVYDSLGQLIRENNKALDKTFVYCYDGIGNITSVKEYSYTEPETDVPSYGTTRSFSYHGTYKDRLTSYGYNSITYNSIGYPTRYGDRVFTWDKGKLVRFYDDIDPNSSSSSDDYRFTYDAYGRRLSKVYEYDPGPDYSGNFTTKIETNYYYDHNGRLVRETSDEDLTESASIYRELIYLYDESGMVGVLYNFNNSNTKAFYYRRNLCGDVVAIYDKSGVRKAEYAYDAYGNCKIIYSASDTDIDEINPIRYRGYYYDRETKLYYLNSRYYNPEWRRFISPDDTSYLDPESVNGLNLYCYCGNDPVNYADPSGHFTLPNWAKWVIGGVAFAGAVALTALTGGALTPLFIGVTSSILLDGIVEGSIYSANKGSFWEGFANGAANGAMFGGVFALGGATLRTIKMFKNGVAIGENMKRVNNLAKAGHQITYKGMPGFKIVKMFGGDNLARTLSMRHNQAFIERMMKWGVKISDFGIDTSRNYRSFYYLMETIVSNGYELLQLMY